MAKPKKRGHLFADKQNGSGKKGFFSEPWDEKGMMRGEEGGKKRERGEEKFIRGLVKSPFI